MVLLSDKSQADDSRKPVYARSGWEIPQEKLDTLHIDKLQADLVKLRCQQLKVWHPNINMRSVSSHPYNCVGLVFASRRTVISIDHIYDILREDGYRQINRADIVVGDVVVYKWQDEASHVALITHITQERPISIRVLSRWGLDGEFEHFIEDVPEVYGQAVEFYTERVV